MRRPSGEIFGVSSKRADSLAGAVMTNAWTSPPGGVSFQEKKRRHRHGQTDQHAEHEEPALRRRRLRVPRGRALVGQELDPGVSHIVKALPGILHEAPAQDITHAPRRLGG